MLKRNTVVLLLLAIGLAVAVLVLSQMDQQGQEKQAQESQLLTFEPKDVEQIQIEEAGENPTTIRLERQEDSWQILEPISTEADVFTVDTLLDTAAELAPAEDLEQTGAESDLSQFGLDPAQEVLSFTLTNGEQSLKLGNKDFDGTGIYALAEDGRLVTIPHSSESRLSPDLFALRNKTLLSLQRNQIETIEIRKSEAGSEDIESILLAQTDGDWQIQEPRTLPVDEITITTLVSPLLSLQASEFAAETQTDLESFGLDTPQAELIITLVGDSEEPEPVRVVLGAENEAGSGFYAITSEISTVAAIPTATAEALQPTLSQLRDKHIAQITPEQVIEVNIEAQDEGLSRMLLPSTGTPSPRPTSAAEDKDAPAPAVSPSSGERLWEVSDQPERLVSLDPLFQALNQARAEDFVSAEDSRAERALRDPLFTIRLDLKDSEDSLVFDFAEAGDQIYGQIPGESDIAILAVATSDSIRAALEDLKPVESDEN